MSKITLPTTQTVKTRLAHMLATGAAVGLAALGAPLAGAADSALPRDAAHAGHHDAAAAAPAAMAPAASAPATAPKGMQMQMPTSGATSAAGARDPHAYSGGYTLETGPYALGGARQLRLGDEQAFGNLLFEKLETVRSNGQSSGAYDLSARFGRDYDRLVIKAEGDVAGGKLQDARTEALWSHAVAPFWDAQLGLRHDSGVGPGRTWMALGVQGLAPYWFELDATAYVGDKGRTALRLNAAYELLVTQRLIVQPQVEINLYGKSDPARGIGKGLADVTSGVRVRYEFSRQFAPYLGVEWAKRFGDTADLARAAGERSRDTRYVAGVRLWF